MAGVAHTTEGARTSKPPGDYDTWADYMRDVEQLEAWRQDETCVRGLKAMRLAPTLAVYRALISGQQVPRKALDQRWARRYGL